MTRCYRQHRSLTGWEWGALVALFERIRHAAAVGLAGPRGKGAPVVDRERIAFAPEMGGAAFALSRHADPCAATLDAQQGSDPAAAAVLVAAARLAPGAFTLGTGDWKAAEFLIDCLPLPKARRRARRVEVIR